MSHETAIPEPEDIQAAFGCLPKVAQDDSSTVNRIMPQPASYPLLSFSVVDGDTIIVTVELDSIERAIQGHSHLRVVNQLRTVGTGTLRIAGVDAPEESKPEQRQAADAVRLAVSRWLARFGRQARVLSQGVDKFGGRWVGDIETCTGNTLSGWLLKNLLVHPFLGDAPKEPWTACELDGIYMRASTLLIKTGTP